MYVDLLCAVHVSDFGGGGMSKQIADPGPEHEKKHELTQWLKSHGAGVIWEEQNPWDYGTFSIERSAASGGRPDLLVFLDGKTFVVEYKTGDSVGQLYDALFQIVRYWEEYTVANTEVSYLVDGMEQSIDGFLTASQHTEAGRLFPQETERRQDFYNMDPTRQQCYQFNQLPPSEYRMTEQHTRTMWRMPKEGKTEVPAERATSDDTPHLGALLSDSLVSPSSDPAPAVLWNKTRHNQHWEVLA
jgi:hypothetical protein